jgi:hypothetical protein
MSDLRDFQNFASSSCGVGIFQLQGVHFGKPDAAQGVPIDPKYVLDAAAVVRDFLVLDRPGQLAFQWCRLRCLETPRIVHRLVGAVGAGEVRQRLCGVPFASPAQSHFGAAAALASSSRSSGCANAARKAGAQFARAVPELVTNALTVGMIDQLVSAQTA